jgi:hypothetical protein
MCWMVTWSFCTHLRNIGVFCGGIAKILKMLSVGQVVGVFSFNYMIIILLISNIAVATWVLD